jgi:hypothetical protein
MRSSTSILQETKINMLDPTLTLVRCRVCYLSSTLIPDGICVISEAVKGHNFN